MIARALCQALLLFAISSGLPSLERPATAGVHGVHGVHGVQGRRHHRRRHHAKKHEPRRERPREGSGEL